MQIWHAILLGIVEGITEFLPISSTGHLTIVEKLLGYHINSQSITAFTAIIQIGSILAAVVYFRKDIVRILGGWITGIFDKTQRNNNYKLGWAVIIGTVPIALVGFSLKGVVETVFRSLWWVSAALVLFSVVMFIADRVGREGKREKDISMSDSAFIGLMQCLALISGVSRSGSTISAALFKGYTRESATRLSFYVGIPALLAAGAYEAFSQYKNISLGVGWTPTIVATVTSFIVAYGAIAWLLKYVSKNNFSIFIWYRVIVGLIIAGLLSFGILSAL
jgi:undecaprenyl-diphosphatase